MIFSICDQACCCFYDLFHLNWNLIFRISVLIFPYLFCGIFYCVGHYYDDLLNLSLIFCNDDLCDPDDDLCDLDDDLCDPDDDLCDPDDDDVYL